MATVNQKILQNKFLFIACILSYILSFSPIYCSDVDDDNSVEERTSKTSRKRKQTSVSTASTRDDLQSPSTVDVGTRTNRAISKKKSISYFDDSDDEVIPPQISVQDLANFPEKVIRIGTQAKLLANVYLQNMDHTANIFVPWHRISFTDGTLREDFFRTENGKICIFVSGGLKYGGWEKTVAHVFWFFFRERVKIIRAHWMLKNLPQNDLEGISAVNKLTNDYEDREHELHSELYYDLYLRHFFLKDPRNRNIASLNINAFSWWDLCDGCHHILGKHKDLVPAGHISYNIASYRRYKHTYPSNEFLSWRQVPSTVETQVWGQIQSKSLEYARKTFDDNEAKEKFWSNSVEGLEICKWLGQAFEQNAVTDEDKPAKNKKKGDVLKFYREMNEDDRKILKNLIEFLKQVNWDLSCWFKHHYVHKLQTNWRRHWRHMVMPHLNWKLGRVISVSNEQCQMCGHKGLAEHHEIFHPKHQVSAKFLQLSPEEQNEEEPIEDTTKKNEKIPVSVELKRKRSIWVGSECVRVVQMTKKEHDEWMIKNKILDKRKDKEEKYALEYQLEQAEKELKLKETEKRRKKKQ